MKPKEVFVRRLCRLVLSAWKAKHMLRVKGGTTDDALLSLMVDEIEADFRREEALDRDAEALLEKHARQLAGASADSRLLFLKIKERLAAERGIVL